MGLRLESRTGISTRWRDERVSPLAYFFSLWKVAMAASALSMLLRAASAEVLEVLAAWRARSVR